MRKYLLIFMFLFLVTHFGQNVSVISNIPITNKDQGSFYHPIVSPDGEAIIFTSENYNNIWMLNIRNGMIKKIVEGNGAGYNPMFSENGEVIVYRKNEYINNKKYSELHEYNTLAKTNELIEQKTRDLSPPLSGVSNTATYTINKNVITKTVSSQLQKNQSSSDLFVTIENSDLVIYENGERSVFNPLGEGNYIWPSISPDGTNILFTYARKGSFVTDLEGNIITELGYSHYPNWSKDGKWIVYMEDRDDGVQVTSSDIFVVSTDGSIKVNITNNQNLIEMYPRWSSSSNDIVYHTIDGVIYKLTLKID